MSGTRLVAVTGAGGFIGRTLVAELLRRGYAVRAITRRVRGELAAHASLELRAIDDLTRAPWGELLPGCESLVHLAAIAHQGRPRDAAAAARVHAVNVEAVGELARAAQAAGLRRMVLVSSIGVLGASSGPRGFDERSLPSPQDDYARSKLAAENAARAVAGSSAFEVSIVRPPLVFGPEAPGNFGQLVRLIRRGVPLPLAAIDNRRSLVSLWNLCDFLVAALEHPAAAGAPLLVADSGTLSTPQLVRSCAAALGVPARLWRVPPASLRMLLGALGRRADFERLCASLTVDDQATRARLSWQPALTLAEGLTRALAPALTVPV